MSDAPIVVEHVDHWYGEGSLRRQILFDVSCVIRAGEIVILSGPSGSGKTTLLTLIGALRGTQAGSLRVLGRELRGAGETALTEVRREIGYVFQSHNLLDALTAAQNVEMGMQLHAAWSPDVRAKRAEELLAGVGLDDLGARYPRQMSGGQRQRVAVARALAAEPRILLADEPTASLDRRTGREIVSLIERLARERGVTVVLVTHDARILDVADRILSLEDGRLASFMSAVTSDTRHLWSLLARDIKSGELVRRVREIEPARFTELLARVTDETRELVEMVDLAQTEAFDGMLAQVLDAFAEKLRELVRSDASRVYLLDEARREMFSLASGEAAPREIRVPVGRAIVGAVAESGAPRVLGDAGADAAFDAEADLGSPGAPLLAAPLADSRGAVFAVVELARAPGREAYTEGDVARVRELAQSLAAVLETWFRMSCDCRAGRGLATRGCCGAPHPPGTPCA